MDLSASKPYWFKRVNFIITDKCWYLMWLSILVQIYTMSIESKTI